MIDRDKYSEYAQYISLGVEIAAALAVPILLGYWLDQYFESDPWLLLAGCLVGLVNFFILIFNINERINKNS